MAGRRGDEDQPAGAGEPAGGTADGDRGDAWPIDPARVGGPSVAAAAGYLKRHQRRRHAAVGAVVAGGGALLIAVLLRRVTGRQEGGKGDADGDS